MFEKMKLGELIEFQRGYDLPKENATKGKYKVISSNGILTYHNTFKSESSVVIGRSGTVGKPQLIEERFWPHNTTLFVKDFKGNNIKYIYYLLSNLKIDVMKSGSNIPTLNRNHLHPLLILATKDIKKQEKIANVLYKIDEKINNNNHINNNLEELMKTIYQRWFIDFEFPNEDGKPYKSSDGKLVYNEVLKQEIPENWNVENCYENSLYTIIKPGLNMFKKKNYLATGNVNESNIADGDWVTYDNRETRANMQSLPSSIWFAKMKNSIKHITIPEKSEWFNEKYVLSTGFLGIKCNENTLSYLHNFIYSDCFEKTKDRLAHGATQEAINNEDLKAIKLLVPNERILEMFEKNTKIIIQSELDIIKENQRLISLKEYLLPLLMNGQINVDDIEI